MNYEEKYKQALERAKERYSACSAPALLEYIFPELKEREDEKIKRELRNDLLLYVPTPERYIAWLEKQGKKPQGKSVLDVWKDMRLEVYLQASGNRHESNYSDDRTKMFSLEDIDEIIEKINEQKLL